MPLFDYHCTSCGEVQEELVSLVDGRAPATLPCSCGGTRERRPGVPYAKIMWSLPPIDNTRDIWAGTKLEDSDGVNETHYKSTKAFALPGGRTAITVPAGEVE